MMILMIVLERREYRPICPIRSTYLTFIFWLLDLDRFCLEPAGQLILLQSSTNNMSISDRWTSLCRRDRAWWLDIFATSLQSDLVLLFMVSKRFRMLRLLSPFCITKSGEMERISHSSDPFSAPHRPTQTRAVRFYQVYQLWRWHLPATAIPKKLSFQNPRHWKPNSPTYCSVK
jgi:hypothetical protein